MSRNSEETPASADQRSEVHGIGMRAAVDALMTDSGLPTYGPHRAVVERRQQLAFEAYVRSISSHPHSAADILAIIHERDRLRQVVEWVAAHKLVPGTYADEDHPYDEWVTPADDEMDFGDVVERAQEVLR